ncbi:MAG TPA: hypothetical protein VM734_22920 [Kofleriaceae bacterium]|jgi:hypothetical protein|nr:hypothetical protein [Kofleriaceae bacterium]
MPATPTRRAIVLGLVTGAACAWAVACSRPAPAPGWQAAQARRNEITALWTQIRDWRREAGLQVEPDASAVLAMRAESVSAAARACVKPPEPHEACADVCDLADAICDNAETICEIARELRGDAWAREKCDSAKASCREAQERCCQCARSADDDVDTTGGPP